MALVRPPPHEPIPPSSNEISTDSAGQLVLLEKPEKERLHRLPAPRREIYLISVKLALLLIFAISYLTFCFIVLHRNIPVGRSGIILGLPFIHFGTLSVITTVAISIVYVALWPIRAIIDEIRAEEFFRLMDTHPNGLPLDSVNAVSATTTGAFDIFMAAIHRHCSPLLTSTLVISLVITVTSIIAPAALSAESVWIDNNSTLLIGALPNNSFVMNPAGYPSDILPVASSIAWAESFLNLTNGYYKITSGEGDQFEYLVPFPPGYTSTMKAHWTTDVIVLDPSCSWHTPTRTTITSDSGSTHWEMTLPNSNLSFELWNSTLVSSNHHASVTRISFTLTYNSSALSMANGILMDDSHILPMDGSVLFVIDQLEYPNSSRTTFPVNLSSIPTLKFPTGNEVAFLLCSPHVSIQTRRVRATGNGNLTLEEPRPSQGNIDFYQANYLLSLILSKLPENSGPTSVQGQVGTDLMLWLIFGFVGTDITTMFYMSPAPLSNITAGYRRIIHAAMKTFLSGRIDKENVPGGYTEEQMVFRSSLGHVITSVILFAFLAITLVVAHFRKGRVAFTLVNVAAALADSNFPQKSAEMIQFKASTGERKVLKLVPGGDGRLYCVYESVD